jgi:NAD(P)-dependent dehydrogenase (short-subunit alcohol dehydrogenase family)
LTRADVLSPKVLDRLAGEAAERFGSLDIMVSLIGGWSGGFDLDEVDDLRWDRALELNLRSAFLAARCAIRHMRAKDWGRLVFVSSRAAREYPGGQAAYNVAKAGVISLVESLANELRFTGITANCVLPSIIDTEAARQVMPHADFDRWPKTGEIAKVIAWLTSDDAGLVSGAAIPVYGHV